MKRRGKILDASELIGVEEAMCLTLNMDGKPDLVAANATSNNISILLNQ